MDPTATIFNASLPLIWLITAAEFFWWRKNRPHQAYPYRQLWITLAGWPLVLVLYALEAKYVGGPYYEWVRAHRLFDMPMANPASWIALVLVNELIYYVTHRLGHAIPWAWANHSVHHEAPQLVLPAAYQLPWLNVLGGVWLLSFPIHLLGFPPKAIAALVGVNLVYAYLLHTEMIPRLGPLEGILNTPAAHRVHHSRREEHHGKNYGSMLVIFDRLFGTYQDEDAARPCAEFGLVEPVGRRGLLRVQLHGWARLARTARVTPVRDLPRLLLAPGPKTRSAETDNRAA